MSTITQAPKVKITRRVNFLSLALLLAAALVLSVASTVSDAIALPRTEVTGNFISISTTIHSVTDDKFNEVIDLSSMVTYTGTLEGTSTLQGTLTVRRDGSAYFKGEEIFTGLVNGMPGTLTFEIIGDCDLYQAIQLTNTITSGTGELAGLQGEISKAGIIRDNGPVGTYIGQINDQSGPVSSSVRTPVTTP